MTSMKNQLSDTWVMTSRILKHNLRSVDTIITVIAMPVMMLLMSVYIFGGAMDLGDVAYIDYIAPSIFLLCIATSVAYTTFRLNNDVTKGIFERFHSMPIAKSSILGGHVLTSIIFNAISVFAVFLVALLMGFSPDTTISASLLAILVLLLFSLAMTWLAIFFGLVAKSTETAGVYSYILMALIFTSSGFAPTETMPAGLRYFAEHQPMTPVIESVRSLLTTGTMTNDTWIAIAWCIGLWVFFRIMAMRVYKRKMA